jgi:glycosyltransferase involved in cell wall biosynthesis
MRIHWAKPFQFVGGNGAGYTLSSRNLVEALHKLGVEFSESSPYAVHYCHPVDCKPYKSKKNILMTMFEGTPVPPEFEQRFKEVDGVLVPTKFVYELFDDIRGKTPMFVSKLGFDPELFTFTRRSWDRDKESLQVLWVGAPNARKGWPYILSTWAHLFQDEPWCNLTMKTSTENGEGRVVQRANVTFDSRRYDRVEDLVALYHKAHVFVLPTLGEGFGLTALEAIATGCPTIATNYSGQLDFMNHDNSWLVPYKFDVCNQYDGAIFNGAIPDIPAMGKAILEIADDYEGAVLKAARGALDVHKKFTWEKAARQFIKNLERLGCE